MHKLLFFVLTILVFSLVLVSPSCKEEGDNLFDDEAKVVYEAIMSVQDQCDEVLASYMASMDSAEAVNSLAKWFQNQPNVEWVVQGTQGLSVKYTNGIFGGIFLNPLRQTSPGLKARHEIDNHVQNNSFKNMPTHKKAIMIWTTDEFNEYDLDQSTFWNNRLTGLDYSYSDMQPSQATLDNLTLLGSNSIISISSHGYAWPDTINIQEIFAMTGEEVSDATTEKYYQDIEANNLLMTNYRGKNIYVISPNFLTKYNDFSKDTVMIYGGFCFSGLGTWPNITNSCASGTYFGFDWIVRSNYCADWAKDIIRHLTDQEVDQPLTADYWMNNSTIDKQYFDATYDRTVQINYTGNGNLTLWSPEYNAIGIIEAVAASGAPVVIPGHTCELYSLRCKVSGSLPSDIYYFWDLGHETAINWGQAGNEVTGRWGLPGTYTVNVEVRKESNNEVIKELSRQVVIEDTSFLENVKTYQNFEMVLSSNSGSGIILSNGSLLGIGYLQFDTYYFNSGLTWNGTSFVAQYVSSSGSSVITKTIQGEISADGKILLDCLLTNSEKLTNGDIYYEASMEIANLPIHRHDEWNCWDWYQWYIEGEGVMNYLEAVDFKQYDFQNQVWITIQSIDFGDLILYGQFDNE